MEQALLHAHQATHLLQRVQPRELVLLQPGSGQSSSGGFLASSHIAAVNISTRSFTFPLQRIFQELQYPAILPSTTCTPIQRVLLKHMSFLHLQIAQRTAEMTIFSAFSLLYCPHISATLFSIGKGRQFIMEWIILQISRATTHSKNKWLIFSPSE